MRFTRLSLDRFGYTPGSGFDFRLTTDIALAQPGRQQQPFDLPLLSDIVIDQAGLHIPEVDTELPGKSSRMDGFDVRPVQVALEPFTLSWADWDQKSADGFRFVFDAFITFPDVCKSPRWIPAQHATLASGRLTLSVADQRIETDGCRIDLGGNGALRLERLDGDLIVDIFPETHVSRPLPFSGSLLLPSAFDCQSPQDRRVPVETGLGLGGQGAVTGRATGLSPPCTLRVGVADIQLVDATFLMDISGGQTAVLSGGGTARLSDGSDPVSAQGTLDVSLEDARVSGGSWMLAGPFEIDLPRIDPTFTFSVGAATIDSQGVQVDGVGQLILDDATRIEATFTHALVGSEESLLSAGAVRFGDSYALDVTVANDGALSWRATTAAQEFTTARGIRATVPSGSVLDSAGFAMQGSGAARIAFDGVDLPNVTSQFSAPFRLDLRSGQVNTGVLEVRDSSATIAYIDRTGFYPNLSALVSELPDRIGLPTVNVAYLKLKDDDGTPLVSVQTSALGRHIATIPGQPLSLFLPALSADPANAPRVEVSVDITLASAGNEIVGGTIAARIPPSLVPVFDLRQRGVPLTVDSIAYVDDGGAYELRMVGRVGLLDELPSVTTYLVLDGSGRLQGQFTMDAPGSLDLVPTSSRLGFDAARIDGSVDIPLMGGTPDWSLDYVGAIRLALGTGEPYRAPATLRLSDQGIGFTNISVPQDNRLVFFDAGVARLGVQNLQVPSLTYDSANGWDFDLRFDLVLAFPSLGDVTLPSIPSVELRRTGLTIPQVTLANLSVDPVEVAGFRTRPLAFRMAQTQVDPFGSDPIALSGAAFDLEVAFGPQAPSALSDLTLTILDAAVTDSGAFGTAEVRTLNPATTLPLGGGGLALNLRELSGTLSPGADGPVVTVTGGGTLTLPESLRCAAAPGDTVSLGGEVTVSGVGGVSGSIDNFVMPCPFDFGPFAIRIAGADLTFAYNGTGQRVELDLDAVVQIPAQAPSDSVQAAGRLGLDVKTGTILRGSIAITQPFRWSIPFQAPLLELVVNQGLLDQAGLHLTGSGSLDLSGGGVAGVQFNDLTLGVPSFEVVGGSATVSDPLAFDAAIAATSGLTWQIASVTSPRPTGQSLRIEAPATVSVGPAGIELAGTSAATLSFADSTFGSLQVSFANSFRIGFDPVAVRTGRAGFELNGSEVAYVDSLGFWPSNVFGALPLPTRLGLPTEDIAYLTIRDDAGQLLLQSTPVDAGLALSTVPNQPLELVIPALAGPDGIAPTLLVGLNATVNSTNFAFLSGAIEISANDGDPALFSLDQAGLSLEVRRLSFAAAPAYSLRADIRVILPQVLKDLTVDLDSIVVNRDGLSGSVAIGDFPATYDPNVPVLASANLPGDIAIAIVGARIDLGSSPDVELAGFVRTRLFTPTDGPSEPIAFRANAGANGVDFTVNPNQVPTSLSLGVASFAPTAVGRFPAVKMTADNQRFALEVSGVFTLPAFGTSFGITLAGLEIATDGVKLQQASLSTPGDWQAFDLFGFGFTLKDLPDGSPALDVAFTNDRLALTLNGELKVFDNTTSFRGLQIASDGNIQLDGANLISQPISIVADVLTLDTLDIRSDALFASFGLDLPPPVNQAGTQRVSFAISANGEVSGDGRIVVRNEAPGLSGGSQFTVGPVTFHPRYLAIELDPGTLSNSSIALVADLYLGGKSASRIKFGDVINNTITPGLKVGFDGEVRWGSVTLPHDFVLDLDVLALTVSQVAGPVDPTRYGVSLGGQLSLDIEAISGALDFTDLSIDEQLALDIGGMDARGGRLTIANIVDLELSGFGLSTTPTTIQIQTGTAPSSDNETVGKTTETVSVQSFVRFGGSLGIGASCGDGPGSDCLFSGGVDEFLLYKTADDGLTHLVIRNASLKAPSAGFAMRADLRYAKTNDGFALAVAGDVTIPGNHTGIVVGALEKGNNQTRAGLFVAVSQQIPIVPPVLLLTQLGGGFFYNPRQEHLDLVRQYARVPDLSQGVVSSPPGRFTGLLYAKASLVSDDIGDARVLLTASENGMQLDGIMALLNTTGDLTDARIRGTLNLTIGFEQAYAEGNFDLTLDYDPLAHSNQNVGFYVYGKDEWGIFGGGELEYLRLIKGDADFFVGPEGFFVQGNIYAGFDFWIVAVEATADASVWYFSDPRDWGAYLRVGISAELLGGLVSGAADLKGALVSDVPNPPLVYGGAEARGCVVGRCAKAQIWAKFQGGKVRGGFGSDPTMDAILARARTARDGLLGARDDMQEAIAQARPAPATIALSEDELAATYARLQTLGRAEVTGIIGNAIQRERQYAAYYPESPNDLDYFNWYRELLAQTGAPTISGGKPLSAYRDSITALLDEISARQAAVDAAIATIDADILDLEQLAAEPWPDSPVQQASFTPPQTTLAVGPDGRERKTIIPGTGPGFTIDRTAADEIVQNLRERQVRTDALQQQIRDQLDALAAGIASVQAATAASGPNSLQQFARLHGDVIQVAEEMYARQGDYILRQQDWLRDGLTQLESRRQDVNDLLNAKSTALQNQTTIAHPLNGLASGRAASLSELSGDPQIFEGYQDVASTLDNQGDPWFVTQADTLGMQLWYWLGYSGMSAADTAATQEFTTVRQEAGSRLQSMRQIHALLTLRYDRLFRRQTELVGSLYDLYDRYLTWLEPPSRGPSIQAGGPPAGFGTLNLGNPETISIASRMTALERSLTTPTVSSVTAISQNLGYMTKEMFYWNGSHPDGTYEFLYNSVPGDAGFLGVLGMRSNGRSSSRIRYGLTPGRGTDEQIRTLRAGVRGGAGFVGLGRAQYTSVFENGGGPARVATSTRISDGTPPSAPAVRVEGAGGTAVVWISDPTQLQMEWSAFDTQSGISAYEYAVGWINDTTVVRDWTTVGGRRSVTIYGLNLEKDGPADATQPTALTSQGLNATLLTVMPGYRVYVRALNGEGLVGPIGRSPPVRLDATPPVFDAGAQVERSQATLGPTAGLSMGQASTSTGQPAPACDVSMPAFPHQTAVTMPAFIPLTPMALPSQGATPSVTFIRPEAVDGESGLSNYAWYAGPDSAPNYNRDTWTESSISEATITASGGALDYEGDFYFSIVAVNNAGLASEPLRFGPFAVVDATAPSEPVFCAAASGLPGTLSASFKTGSADAESGIAGYQYRIRREDGAVVRNWPAEGGLQAIVTGVDAVDWTPFASAPAMRNAPVAGLQDGERYFFDVRAVNGQNRKSSSATSGPILVDFTPPETPLVTRVDVQQSVFGMQSVRIRVNAPGDPHSGSWVHQWAIADEGSSSPLAWGTLFGRQGTFWADLPTIGQRLQSGRTYRVTLRTVNRAGLTSSIATTSFTVPR